jgi:methylated-DNA-[protein]-cysteine S-methyltransferase
MFQDERVQRAVRQPTWFLFPVMNARATWTTPTPANKDVGRPADAKGFEPRAYNSQVIQLSRLDSPIGPLTLGVRNASVCMLFFDPDGERVRHWLARWYPGQPVEDHKDPAGAGAALREYFGGRLDALDAIPVEMNGTAFQKQVWAALRSVPSGRTASYADIARAIGTPAAVRAVGAANGANPVSLIVPCHRIIGTNGSLTGYGGGLDRKRWLLRHEASSGFTLHA